MRSGGRILSDEGLELWTIRCEQIEYARKLWLMMMMETMVHVWVTMSEGRRASGKDWSGGIEVAYFVDLSEDRFGH